MNKVINVIVGAAIDGAAILMLAGVAVAATVLLWMVEERNPT